MYRKLIYLTCLVFVLSMAGSARANLLGYYKFDETEGLVAADSSGNGFDGTVNADPNWIAGYLDGAIELGSSNFVTLPADRMGLTSEVGSVAVWMRIPDREVVGINTIWWGGDNITGGGFGPENEMHIMVEQPVANVWVGGEFGFYGLNNPNFHCHSDPEKADATQPGTPPVNPFTVNDGEWHHIVGTWDMAVSAARLYFEGEFVQEGVLGDSVYELNNMFLGKMANDTRTYSGALDEVQICNHAMSDLEILVSYLGSEEAALKAFKPSPASGAVDVEHDVVLSWKAGARTVTQNVYFGTDFNDVNEASIDNPLDVLVSQNQADPNFNASGLIDFGVTYYWRVDGVEEDGVTINKGNVWSFEALNFLVVDDFEDYNDYEPDTIYFAWVDGYGDPSNGSTSGYAQPIFSAGEHFVEVETVYSGLQAFPYFYDNIAAPDSQARKEFGGGDLTDWTMEDVNTLTLFYYGDANNAPEPMFVMLNDRDSVENGDPNAALTNGWNRWDIPLQEFADRGVNLRNVSSMTIGFGDGPPGGAGMVIFDAIRLYRPAVKDD